MLVEPMTFVMNLPFYYVTLRERITWGTMGLIYMLMKWCEVGMIMHTIKWINIIESIMYIIKFVIN